MTQMRKSVQMRAMNLLHYVLTTGVMIAAWFVWCVPMMKVHNTQVMSISVCV